VQSPPRPRYFETSPKRELGRLRTHQSCANPCARKSYGPRDRAPHTADPADPALRPLIGARLGARLSGRSPPSDWLFSRGNRCTALALASYGRPGRPGPTSPL
jgi:hypothetical protein